MTPAPRPTSNMLRAVRMAPVAVLRSRSATPRGLASSRITTRKLPIPAQGLHTSSKYLAQEGQSGQLAGSGPPSSAALVKNPSIKKNTLLFGVAALLTSIVVWVTRDKKTKQEALGASPAAKAEKPRLASEGGNASENELKT